MFEGLGTLKRLLTFEGISLLLPGWLHFFYYTVVSTMMRFRVRLWVSSLGERDVFHILEKILNDPSASASYWAEAW